MRHIIYISILAIITFSSCTFEEENIFDKSAAERMNAALSDYKTTLCTSPNGWVVEYFPTDTTEGYTFLMKFEKTTKVTMAAKNRWVNNAFTLDSCVYDLSGDNGPVLSFPVAGSYVAGGTQIGIFHLFASPQDPKGSSNLDGYGLQGDYEFVMTSVTDTLIIMTGKKRNTLILMHPVPATKTWAVLFNELDEMRSTIIGTSSFPLNMIIEKDTFILKNDLRSYGAKAGKFRIYPKGTDQLIDGIDYAYIITDKGLRLHTPFKHNAKLISNFTLSSDKLKLQAENKDISAQISGTNPVEYFLSNNISCNVVFTQPMGTKFKIEFDKIVANCQSKLKEKFTNLYFKYNGTRNSYTLAFKSGIYTGIFDFTRINLANGTITFAYSGTKDTNATYYYNNIPGFKELVGYMSQTFQVTTVGGLGSSILQCTSTTDSEISFVVSVQ